MPLYEYSCQQCGKRFEVLQKFSDSPVQVHEGCGGAVDRLISPSSFRFKGSGFYITDYAGGGKGANGGGAQSKHEEHTQHPKGNVHSRAGGACRSTQFHAYAAQRLIRGRQSPALGNHLRLRFLDVQCGAAETQKPFPNHAS